MSATALFSPYRLGRVVLHNRIVMAPMTRSRCPGNLPGHNVVTYYTQRATAGLIITEGTSPSANGLGYARIPGLFTDAQVAAWRHVTDAVHAHGGHIFAQLMHTGRVGHAANLPVGGRVLAPSAIAAPGQMYTDAAGLQDHPVPEVMTEADIEAAITEFVAASDNAIKAGFDGVELHGANGYLIDQFLNVASNQRTDRWGGSVDNRARFALAVAERVAAKIGADRVGIRLSPYGGAGGMVADADTDALYTQLASALSAMGLAYIHVVDHSAMGGPKPKPELIAAMRKAFKGTFILAGGYDAARATADITAGNGDLIAFGRPWISNPDLAHRLEKGLELTATDYATLYTPGDKGYIDYP